MGGKAFITSRDGEPGLSVPRMDGDLYFELKRRYLDILNAFFRLVASSAEAPGKDSYGDIDIIVADPDDTAFETTWHRMPLGSTTQSSAPTPAEIRKDVLMHILGARRYLCNSNTSSFAVPHPKMTDAYVQLDINLQSVEMHPWLVFHHSYGDLWNILGTSVRAFGLTPSEEGLFVRDPEIEKLDRKRGRTLLSRDPAAVLSFIGLDITEWNQGWENELQMFYFATRCKFFRPFLYTKKCDLKANDRKRLRQRPCFQRFVEEFVPEIAEQQSRINAAKEVCMAERGNSLDDRQSDGWVQLDRKEVLEDALTQFDAWERYTANHRTWVAEREALERKREEKTARRVAAIAANKSYGEHWIDWFLSSLNAQQRCMLNLDLDKANAGEV